jgi:hypothetical protein
MRIARASALTSWQEPLAKKRARNQAAMKSPPLVPRMKFARRLDRLFLLLGQEQGLAECVNWKILAEEKVLPGVQTG